MHGLQTLTFHYLYFHMCPLTFSDLDYKSNPSLLLYKLLVHWVSNCCVILVILLPVSLPVLYPEVFMYSVQFPLSIPALSGLLYAVNFERDKWIILLDRISVLRRDTLGGNRQGVWC